MASNRKQLTVNSLILSLRMFVTMVIALFTSRLVLQNLGVADYGIYNVLAGVIALFSFIQGALVGATSRFLSFQLGSSNSNSFIFNKLLNASVLIHIITSVILLLLAETVGVYFVNKVLDIPQEKLFISNVVFQISVINSIIIFLSLPFESVLIAYEKMDKYALVSVLESVLKLIVAICIGLFPDERMLYYALFLLFSTIIVKFLIFSFARKCINGFVIKLRSEKEYFKPLLSFFSWDLYGNLSVVMQSQGVSILQNVYFGPIANASIAISNQILIALGSFSNNILYAIKPQIIKAYAKNDFKELNSLINLGTKFSFIITFLLSVPVFFKMDSIMHVWLVSPPKYAIEYAKIAVIINLIGGLNGTINHAIHATGKIKALSFITGTFYLLILPITYFLYRYGFSSISSYYVALGISILAVITNSTILKVQISKFQSIHFLIVLIKIVLITVSIFIIGHYLDKIFFVNNSLLNFFIFSIIITIISISVVLISLFTVNDRKYIINLFRKRVSD